MIVEEYEATVTNNEDPERRCRIKVACVGLLGDEETELPMWVEPVLNWGWFIVPDPGETIAVQVIVSSEQDESFHQSSIDNLDIKWKGTRFYTSEETEGETEVRTPHEDFLENYGKRRGFATPNGHILYFDDTEGKQKIQLTWKQGNDYCYLTFDDKGSVILANKNGSYINLDAENEVMTFTHQEGHLINMTSNDVSIIDKFANVINMKDGAIQIISQDSIVLTGKSTNVKTGSVDIGEGADAFIVRGTDLLVWLAAHIHNDSLGAPTTPPTPGIPPTPLLPELLSTVAKVK